MSRQPHIVTLLRADFASQPQLMLEYVPGGSLEDQGDMTISECVSILHQCLSALKYLHTSNPPIVHRDIKPANIFVQYRNSDSIYVKFGDFGLSRDYDNMSTICGSWHYLAPEIYLNHQFMNEGGSGRVIYTAAVDVWSLGVVVYELLCSLPKYKERYRGGGIAWCAKVIEKIKVDLKTRPDEVRQFLLDTMLIISPASRCSAQYCHRQALLLSDAGYDRHSERPNPPVNVDKNVYVNDEEQATVRYSVEDGTFGDPHTIVWRPSSSKVKFATKAREDVRSSTSPGQAVASASRTSQKRPTAMSTSSSSGSRQYTKRRGRVEPPSRLLHLKTWIEDEQEKICDPGQLRASSANKEQLENDWEDQEAFKAALFLQTLGQDPHPGNLCRSVFHSLVVSKMLNLFKGTYHPRRILVVNLISRILTLKYRI